MSKTDGMDKPLPGEPLPGEPLHGKALPVIPMTGTPLKELKDFDRK
jgi:hypothetical protein